MSTAGQRVWGVTGLMKLCSSKLQDMDTTIEVFFNKGSDGREQVNRQRGLLRI
jgi:hypothetical protein